MSEFYREFSNSAVTVEKTDGNSIKLTGFVKDGVLYCSYFAATGDFTVKFNGCEFIPAGRKGSTKLLKGAKIVQIPVVEKIPNDEQISNLFTDEEKEKLASVEEGAQRNTVTSVNGTSGDVFVQVPEKVSDLLNDSGYLTQAPVTSVNGKVGKVSINKKDVGLEKVENISLDEFMGSESIQIVGKIRIGEWQAEPIADAHVESARKWDDKLDDISGLIEVGGGLSLDGDGTAEKPYRISGPVTNSMPVGTGGGSKGGAGVKTLNALKGDLLLVGGTNIEVEPNPDGTITINATGSASGEANTSSNLGAGVGLAAAKVGVDLPFKSLVAGSNITLTPATNTVTITAAAAPVTSVNGQAGVVVLDAADVGAATSIQGGLADTAVQPGDLATVATSGNYSDLSGTPTIPNAIFSTISVSGQSNVVADSATDTLTLVAGTGITITTDASADSVTINATGGGGGGDINDAANNGNDTLGGGVFKEKSTDTLVFNRLIAGSNITISGGNASGGDITIAGGAGGGGIPEAPDDGDIYGRSEETWVALGTMASESADDYYTAAEADTIFAGVGDVITQFVSLDDIDFTGATVGGGNYALQYSTVGGGQFSEVILGSAALEDSSAFATSIQGGLADTAVQPGDLATVATSGDYGDLSNLPTLVTALDGLSDVTITTPGGGEALVYDVGTSQWINSLLATVAFTGDYEDLSNQPSIPVNLSDLADTAISGPADGELLRYDTVVGGWRNSDLAGAGIQPASVNLDDLAALTPAANKAVIFNSSSDLALIDFATFSQGLIDNTSAAGWQTDLGLVPGTNVQPYDADLAAIAGLTSAANKLPYFTGSGTAAVTDLTSTARNLLDDTSEGAMRTTLSAASTTQADACFAGVWETPTDKTLKLVVKAPHGGTITEVTTVSASGTCTATFKINTTALGGTANSVSSSEQSQSHSSANVFSAGDDIAVTISSNSSCADMSFTIKYTRTLS